MSERDRLERELRESEERYRFLIENSPDIIFSIDPDGQFTYVSDSVRRSLGVEPEELVGTPFRDLIEYRADEIPGEQFALLAADPELELTNRMDLKQRDGGGARRSRSARSGSGATACSPGSRAPPATSPSASASSGSCASREERYRFLVENSPDIVFSTDAEGNFTFVSDDDRADGGLRRRTSSSAATSRRSSTSGRCAAALERWSRPRRRARRPQVVAT